MLKYAKHDPDLPDLIRGSQYSAGIDLYSIEDEFFVNRYNFKTVRTGVSVEIPEGFLGLITVRSSLGFKYDLETHNGVIDSDYRGEILVRLRGNTIAGHTVRKYDRIAQLLIIPLIALAPSLVSIEELSETDRGEGGIGSTGV